MLKCQIANFIRYQLSNCNFKWKLRAEASLVCGKQSKFHRSVGVTTVKSY